MTNGNWKAILITVFCFALITVWPGPEYWYIGAALYAVFLGWLAYKTFIE